MLQVRAATDCTRYSRGVAGAATSLPPPPPPVHRRQRGLITRRLTRVSSQRLPTRPLSSDHRSEDTSERRVSPRAFYISHSPEKCLRSARLARAIPSRTFGETRREELRSAKCDIKPRLSRALNRPNLDGARKSDFDVVVASFASIFANGTELGSKFWFC